MWTAPSANLESEFAAVLLRAGSIPTEQRHDGGTLQPRDIAHNECIRSISEVTSRLDLRATPLVVILRDPQMEGSGIINPRVSWIKSVSRSTTKTGRSAHGP